MSRDPDPTGRDASEFFLEIESRFAERRGTPFVLSAKDWALMNDWFDQGIPLPIILEAIDGCFESHRKGGRRRSVSSLSYCRFAVRDLWRERKDLHVGGSESLPEADMKARLAEISALVEQAASEAREAPVAAILRDTAAKTASLAITSMPEVDQALLDLEGDLIDRIRDALPSRVLTAIQQKVEEQLRNIAFSDDSVRERTEQATFIREIRRFYAIPRLTLLS